MTVYLKMRAPKVAAKSMAIQRLTRIGSRPFDVLGYDSMLRTAEKQRMGVQRVLRSVQRCWYR